MNKIEGKVLLDEDEIGTFIVDSKGELQVDFNGGRWSAMWVFEWALRQEKSLHFIPVLGE
jgi:hypothetical protein